MNSIGYRLLMASKPIKNAGFPERQARAILVFARNQSKVCGTRSGNSGNITVFSLACFIIVALLGAFFFGYVRQIGGMRELEHSCDAGILNAARQALITPTVKLSEIDSGKYPAVTDFFRLTVPANSGPSDFTNGFNLLTYNRVIGQALLVTNNAEAEGSPVALSHAREVIHAAQAVGTALRAKLTGADGSNPLNSFFFAISQKNPLECFGISGASVQLNKDISSSYMRANYSANIFLDPTTMVSATPADSAHPSADFSQGIPPAGLSLDYYKTVPNDISVAATGTSPAKVVTYFPQLSYSPSQPFSPSYYQGYAPIQVLGQYGTPETLTAVPNFPQQSPHLVNLQNFDKASNLGAPDSFSPPNSFEANCKTTDAHHNLSSTTLAAALVGCLSNDFVASIPAGYIRVTNVGTATSLGATAVSGAVYDGSNDLFNTAEAAAPSAVWVSPPVACPSQDNAIASLACPNLITIQEWETFAESEGTGNEKIAGKVYNQALDPLVPYGDLSSNHKLTDVISPKVFIAISNGPKATLADYLALAANKGQPIYTYSAASLGLADASVSTLKKFIGDDGSSKVVGTDVAVLLAHGGSITSQCFDLFDLNVNPGTMPNWINDTVANAISTHFGRSTASVPGTSSTSYYDIVTWLKKKVMDERSQHICFSVALPWISSINGALSGMQHYERTGPTHKDPNPRAGISPYAYVAHYSDYSKIEQKGTGIWSVTSASKSPVQDGSPAAYLTDIVQEISGPLPTSLTSVSTPEAGSPGDHSFNSHSTLFNNFISNLTARARQINPKFSQTDVLNALGFNNIASQPGQSDFYNSNTPALPMGSTLYLHADPNNPNNLVLDSNVPYDDPSITVDNSTHPPNSFFNALALTSGMYVVCGGDSSLANSTTQVARFNSLVDTVADLTSAAPVGDMGYHAGPDMTAPVVTAEDNVTFVPSSGYNNLLGWVNFSTQLTTKNNKSAVSFSEPN